MEVVKYEILWRQQGQNSSLRAYNHLSFLQNPPNVIINKLNITLHDEKLIEQRLVVETENNLFEGTFNSMSRDSYTVLELHTSLHGPVIAYFVSFTHIIRTYLSATSQCPEIGYSVRNVTHTITHSV